MANDLKVAKVFSIHTLHAQGWSQRQIARELGINRETVARHLKTTAKPTESPPELVGSKPAKAPTGSEQGGGESKPAKALTGSRSVCHPFQEVILAKLGQGLSAQRIYQDLIEEHGFLSKYHSVRRFVAKLKQSTPLPFRRIEVAPGQEAQVDFGTGAPIIDQDGRRRRTHVLRIVLSHSRKAYSEAVYRQTTENVIRCLENAFWHFGGVPKTLVPDNMKTAVLKADWYDPDLNPKLRSFCEHYETVLLPTKVRTPRHKGKVERGVDYVQENALKGRKFASLGEQNAHLLHWETTIADTRIHGTTRKQVSKVFQQNERHALGTLPLERFPCFQEAQRIVSRDGHVSVDKSYYSVPPEHLGRTLWVRWNSRLVRILNDRMEVICTHATQPKGKFSTLPEHIASEKISPVRWQEIWLASEFSAVPEGLSTIVSMRMRPDGSVTTPNVTSAGDYELWLSSTDAGPGDALSNTFAENRGDDALCVYKGPIRWETDGASGPTEGPRAFDYIVEFTEPFTYDPSAGKNLLVEEVFLRDVQGAILGDAELLGATRTVVGIPASATMTDDSRRFSNPAVRQFEFVPEPSTLFLCIVALGVVGGLRKWKRTA